MGADVRAVLGGGGGGGKKRGREQGQGDEDDGDADDQKKSMGICGLKCIISDGVFLFSFVS